MSIYEDSVQPSSGMGADREVLQAWLASAVTIESRIEERAMALYLGYLTFVGEDGSFDPIFVLSDGSTDKQTFLSFLNKARTVPGIQFDSAFSLSTLIDEVNKRPMTDANRPSERSTRPHILAKTHDTELHAKVVVTENQAPPPRFTMFLQLEGVYVPVIDESIEAKPQPPAETA